nr:immunoglobulin light chain junction region [Macaca mulatta]MOW08320.1 immunoglobulin light chain junction region [Macaca mulatta]MOW10369.1 immunoglobulin light chain junction region [Macaca mulatta]
CQQNYGDPWTF